VHQPGLFLNNPLNSALCGLLGLLVRFDGLLCWFASLFALPCREIATGKTKGEAFCSA